LPKRGEGGIYQMTTDIKSGLITLQMSTKFTNIFHSKALQTIPKFGFWYENIPSGNPDADLERYTTHMLVIVSNPFCNQRPHFREEYTYSKKKNMKCYASMF
jgi:hypothetical protein